MLPRKNKGSSSPRWTPRRRHRGKLAGLPTMPVLTRPSRATKSKSLQHKTSTSRLAGSPPANTSAKDLPPTYLPTHLQLRYRSTSCLMQTTFSALCKLRPRKDLKMEMVRQIPRQRRPRCKSSPAMLSPVPKRQVQPSTSMLARRSSPISPP